MARIVMATFGSYGDLFPFLALGRELRARGHDPVLAASELYRDLALRNGLGFAPIRPDVDLDDRELLRRCMDRMKGMQVILQEIVIPSLRDMYAGLERAAEGADLIVSHVLTFAAPILAEKSGLPWVSTTLQPMAFCSAHEPPAFAPIPWFAQMRRYVGPGFTRIAIRLLQRVSWSWSEPIRAFRAELGLTHDADPLFEGQHSPHGVLALFSGVFAAPQPDWPANTTVCGFPFHDEEEGWETGDLDAFLDAGEPPVAYTLGSAAVQAAGRFFHEGLEAARRSGRRTILVAGPQADDLRDVPDHVLVIGSAPYHRLFPRCAAVVHSGGIGTTSQALRAGAAQVVVPWSHDQFDNGNRVEWIQCGLRLRGRPTARALEAAVDRALASSSGTADVAKQVAAERGPSTAVDVMERVL